MWKDISLFPSKPVHSFLDLSNKENFMRFICVIYLAAAVILPACSTSGKGGGLLDPDCTAEKAAKSAAMKSTVGIGGRCTPAEATKDTAKRAVQ